MTFLLKSVNGKITYDRLNCNSLEEAVTEYLQCTAGKYLIECEENPNIKQIIES
jgi:hypothetical protein